MKESDQKDVAVQNRKGKNEMVLQCKGKCHLGRSWQTHLNESVGINRTVLFLVGQPNSEHSIHSLGAAYPRLAWLLISSTKQTKLHKMFAFESVAQPDLLSAL